MLSEQITCTHVNSPRVPSAGNVDFKGLFRERPDNSRHPCKCGNPNSGNLWFDSGIKGKALFSYLTPRECMLFMGFTDEDYDKLTKRNPEVKSGASLFSRDKIIRMAGNSIPVKLLEGVILQIRQLDESVFC